MAMEKMRQVVAETRCTDADADTATTRQNTDSAGTETTTHYQELRKIMFYRAILSNVVNRWQNLFRTFKCQVQILNRKKRMLELGAV